MQRKEHYARGYDDSKISNSSGLSVIWQLRRILTKASKCPDTFQSYLYTLWSTNRHDIGTSYDDSNVSSTIQKFIGVEPSGFTDAKGIFKNVHFLIEKQRYDNDNDNAKMYR